MLAMATLTWQISQVEGDNVTDSYTSVQVLATATNNTGLPYLLPIVNTEQTNVEGMTGYANGAPPFPLTASEWQALQSIVGAPKWTARYNTQYQNSVDFGMQTQNPSVVIADGQTARATLTRLTEAGKEIHYLVDTTDPQFSWGDFPIEGEGPEWFYGMAMRVWLKQTYTSFAWTFDQPGGGGSGGGGE